MTTGRLTYLCGGDETPGPRGTTCPNPVHDHSLPAGYVDAATVAGRRLHEGWRNPKCPDCQTHGWVPPVRDGHGCPCEAFGLDPDNPPTDGVFTIEIPQESTDDDDH